MLLTTALWFSYSLPPAKNNFSFPHNFAAHKTWPLVPGIQAALPECWSLSQGLPTSWHLLQGRLFPYDASLLPQRKPAASRQRSPASLPSPLLLLEPY